MEAVINLVWSFGLTLFTAPMLQDPPKAFEAIENFIKSFESLLTTIAASVAVIGVMGLGVMYLGSSIPLVSEWREQNPKAFRDVTWGLIFLILAGGGGVTALLTF